MGVGGAGTLPVGLAAALLDPGARLPRELGPALDRQRDVAAPHLQRARQERPAAQQHLRARLILQERLDVLGVVCLAVALGTALPGVAARGVGGLGGAQREDQRQQRPRHRHPVHIYVGTRGYLTVDRRPEINATSTPHGANHLGSRIGS